LIFFGKKRFFFKKPIRLWRTIPNTALLWMQSLGLKSKVSRKNDALQKDYDKLLCDYHTLEQEIEQYYDSKKGK
jgi:hypothetical protein